VASLLPLHNFYSILIRLLEAEPSISEAGETWVRNMAAEFCLQIKTTKYRYTKNMKTDSSFLISVTQLDFLQRKNWF
jgi:hypothetical protein